MATCPWLPGLALTFPPPTSSTCWGGGVGTAVTNIIGRAALPGQMDGMGVGGIRPELNVTVGTALATSSSATLNVAFEAAADDGSNQPDTWYTLVETGELTAAQCAAETVIARLPWLPPFPANLRPRFLRLLFKVPAGTTFTAGTISSALVTTVRDDQFNKQASSNYTVL